jgi:UDP-N-acetylmuramoyl-tripeptide--D-alanyl-D-alanine ligase
VIPLSLAEVEQLAPGDLRAEPWADEITGVQIDSRRIAEGDLFVAVGGGADFRTHARARGAAATLVPAEPFGALAALGQAVRDRSSARMVAITGSIGKTTTKDILAGICAPQLRTVAAERSYNNELGVPLTLCRLEAETELCIVELAMRGFGQIAELARYTRPDIGVVTAIAPVHLEKVGSLEGVVQAKTELITALPPGGVAVVPAGFPVEREDLELTRVGEDVRLEAFEPPRLVTSLGTFEVGFAARHLALNAVTALATARALGLELPERIEATFAEWRNQEISLPGGGLLINDAWNAHPISMRAALEHLADRAGGRRRVAVLGQMAELGDYSEAAHREVADAIQEIGVDVLIAVGPQASVYGGHVVGDAAEATEALRDQLRPGDCVLVKGARALGLEAVAEALTTVAT